MQKASNPERYVKDIRLVEKMNQCTGGWSLAEQLGWSNGDLNQKAGGKDIWICLEWEEESVPDIQASCCGMQIKATCNSKCEQVCNADYCDSYSMTLAPEFQYSAKGRRLQEVPQVASGQEWLDVQNSHRRLQNINIDLNCSNQDCSLVANGMSVKACDCENYCCVQSGGAGAEVTWGVLVVIFMSIANLA